MEKSGIYAAKLFPVCPANENPRFIHLSTAISSKYFVSKMGVMHMT